MLWNSNVRSGRLLLCLKYYSADPIEALAALFAERGSPAIGFAALSTSRLKTRPAVVAKDRIKRILGLTFRANHNLLVEICSFSGKTSLFDLVACLATRS